MKSIASLLSCESVLEKYEPALVLATLWSLLLSRRSFPRPRRMFLNHRHLCLASETLVREQLWAL